MNYKDIILSIKQKKIEPIYFLCGEESYFIDEITKTILKFTLTKEEKSFNQIVLYAKDTNTEEIISEAKQFPFGSKKKVVIIKEAQHLKKIENLINYFEKPQLSTVLVFEHKNKSIDKRKKISKTIINRSIFFESKKLYENQISNWIINYLEEKNYKIDIQAATIISENIGNDLSKITNELSKLMLAINLDDTITSTHIENYIGISKDYNVFELQKSLGEKNITKSNKITNHLSLDSKNNHIILVISSLFSFFQKIITYHSINDKSSNNVALKLKINPYFISQYKYASTKYSINQLITIIGLLKEYDLKSKGVNNKNTSHSELLKELIFKILHC